MANTLGIATVLFIFLAIGSPQMGTSPKGGCDTQADPCGSASTQRDMNLCFGQQYSKTDALLNTVYRDQIKRLSTGPSPDQKQNESIERLKQAQRAWITYRDLHCSIARDQYEGGSMAPMVWSMCMETVTQHRIEELNAAYNDQ